MIDPIPKGRWSASHEGAGVVPVSLPLPIGERIELRVEQVVPSHFPCPACGFFHGGNQSPFGKEFLDLSDGFARQITVAFPDHESVGFD